VNDTSATGASSNAAHQIQGKPGGGRTVAIVLLTLALAIVTGYALLQVPSLRARFARKLQPPSPALQSNPFELRSVLLDARDDALRRGDLLEAANINSTFAREAHLRALAVHHAWLERRHPQTRLYSQGDDHRPEWNYRNTAADFFAFHLHAALRLKPSAMESIRETLGAEAALDTPEGLCQPVIAATAEPVAVDHDELLFGSSEYVKDGLLSVYERHGGALIGGRMFEIVDAIIAQSRTPSRFGNIPGHGAEINGNLLQVCGRLSYASGRSDLAEFAARIADAVIEQSLAANGGIPPQYFDYASNRVTDSSLKLKDHGNEVILGLSEAYAMAVDRGAEDPRWSQRAGRWCEPIARMYEIVLTHGVNNRGLLAVAMEPSPPRIVDERLSDNWGYVLTGALLFVESSRRHQKLPDERINAIEARVEAIARSAFARDPARSWDGTMDSDADVVESALYVAHYHPPLREEALRFADRQIGLMYRHQTSDGTADRRYLDGNFIRTSLMYADALAGGWRADPWREDVRVGFAQDDRGNAIVIVRCSQPYSGTLRADSTRHRTIMNLPWDWPRLNSWPQWFVPDEKIQVAEAAGFASTPTAQALREGVPLDLPASGEAVLRLRTSAPTTSPARVAD
jgi:hypothetical protein